ncbi:hypothetical protein BN85400900 [Alteracholeplasma palmae J233]|uniref:Uncharacterized protein n=1 Tax=Alteracholeplasma palmae (strain ATCC 49389 / J233) TaxID=1318466 RepID=U4KJR0_ALTPJ|nr:hypothetical protein BN85400900 [Alteracholeplasma palmae J233]
MNYFINIVLLVYLGGSIFDIYKEKKNNFSMDNKVKSVFIRHQIPLLLCFVIGLVLSIIYVKQIEDFMKEPFLLIIYFSLIAFNIISMFTYITVILKTKNIEDNK